MFRKIALFLTLVLVIGALFGCASSGQLIERTLTEAEKDKILQAYATSFDELKWGVEDDSYYGNYDGYDIFLITEKRFHESTGGLAYVNGEGFGHRYHAFDLYGYRDGELHTLGWLYNQGLVSAESAKTLSQINDLGKPKNLPALSSQLKKEFEKAWSAYYLAKYEKCNWTWKDSEQFDENTSGIFEYTYSVEGYDILYRHSVGGVAILGGVTVGEYTFKDGYPFQIYAHKGGEMYLLVDLYENKKISEKSIEALYEKHKEQHSVYYD